MSAYTHVTKVGRWTVKDGGTIPARGHDGRPLLSAEQVTNLEMRAAITVLKEVELVAGEELKFARKAMGLRQTDLPDPLGVSSGTVCRWETNEETFKRPVQLAVLRLLDEFQRIGSIARPLRAPRASDRVLMVSDR